MSEARRHNGPRSEQELVARCHQLRLHVRARKLASHEELEQVWPLIEAEATVWDWTFAFAQLVRYLGRDERVQDIGGAVQAAVEDRALAALHDEPIRVELLSGAAIEVHPKGLMALRWLAARDWMVGWLTERIDLVQLWLLEERADVEPSWLLGLEEELSWQLAMIAHEVSHPGPALSAAAEPDGRWLNANAIDLLRIHAAFAEVNLNRFVAVSAIAPPALGGKRLSWAGLMAGYAERTGQDAVHLAHNRSLIGILSQIALTRPEPDPKKKKPATEE